MKISSRSGSINLCILLVKSIIGAGILSLPSMMKDSGYVTGIILLLFTGFLTIYSLVILADCASQTIKGRETSFYRVMDNLFPGLGSLPEVFIFLKCLGISAGLLVQVGVEMRNQVQKNISISGVFQKDEIWIVLAGLVIAFSTYFKKIERLKYTSTIGLLAVGYLMFVLFLEIWKGKENNGEITKFPENIWGFLNAIPIAVFSFGCQENLYSIYNEARDNRTRQIVKISGVSVGLSTFAYLFVGVLGYLKYGSNSKSSLLMNFPDEWYFRISKISYCLLLLFSYPLTVFPMRAALMTFLPQKIVSKPEKQLRWTLTTLLITMTIILALFIPDLNMAQKIVGTIASPAISFIIPAIMHIRVMQRRKKRAIASILLLLFGILIFILSLTALIKEFFFENK